MDVGAGGCGSVPSWAGQMGKAMEDPIKGMSARRRVGVSFSAVQKSMIRNFIETGRVAGATNVLLNAIEKQVGGAGAAQGRTAGRGGACEQAGEVRWASWGGSEVVWFFGRGHSPSGFEPVPE